VGRSLPAPQSGEGEADSATGPAAAPAGTTTPAPVVIVKQVNEIHEDGSYTVGFEAADGTFKMETRDAEGNVVGGAIFNTFTVIIKNLL
jgi:hypothetical protein